MRQRAQRKEAVPDDQVKSILEAIAKEYLVRRQNGETLDQIVDSLYKHSEAGDCGLIAFGA